MKYANKTRFLRSIDGDTVEMMIDLGLNCFRKEIIRLARIDAPELKAVDPAEHKRAVEAKEYVQTWCLSRDGYWQVETLQKDPYGRWVGEVYYQTENLSDELLKSGHAKPYGGKG